jgi:hypothetical protein
MIQFSWPELLLFLISALLFGAAFYSFLPAGNTPKKNEAENSDDDLIGAEAMQRLRNYDLGENTSQQYGNNEEGIKQLEKRVEKLEEQFNLSVDRKQHNQKAEESLFYSDISESQNDHKDSNESSEEDQYLQAREEMELALFKAKRQLTRYETILQEHKNFSSAETDSNQAENRLANELTQRAEIIEQLNLSFQKNPHTAFSLLQMQQRLREQMDALSLAEAELQQVKA